MRGIQDLINVLPFFVAVKSEADMPLWCAEHFGTSVQVSLAEHGVVYASDYGVWGAGPKGFYFRKENDALFFKLRWVG